MHTIQISNNPNANEIWSGIGGHFDSLGQILNEFFDNSISNFEGNDTDSREIRLTMKELSNNGDIEITIDDSGTGIKDLNRAFTLGSRGAAESPLNEHGFGLKHALASANPENNSWEICTRTQDDAEKNQFKRIRAPYKIGDFQAQICNNEPWCGSSSTGTVVKFTCSREMYTTIARGIPGGMKNFIPIANVLHEDIGFTYSGIIKENKASISMILIDCDEKKSNHRIGAIEPDWAQYIKPYTGVERVDLGNGFVDLEYKFGKISDKAPRKEFDNNTTRKYYKKSMSSSGVEIRINGRVLCSNLFKEIWGIEKHNSYNSLLIMINIKSDNINALPKTRTSKNGLREGDARLENLYSWIRSNMKDPVKDVSLATHEIDLFETIKKNMLQYNPDKNKVIETEMNVFTKTGNKKDKVRIDLYTKSTDGITIYEGKRDSTSSKDIYQLRMYWDGLVYDGINPDKGYLVAESHPESVISLITIVNSMKDANGNNYNFGVKTWEEMGLNM